MMLHTVSPMSCRSPLVRVIESKYVLEDFDFFRYPTCSLSRCHFSCVDSISGSMPPFFVMGSYSGKDDFWPSRSFSAACCYSIAAFAVSCASCAFATVASFLLFSANFDIRSFSSSFFLYATDFTNSNMKLARVCHSDSHDSSTAKMTLFVAK